MVKGSDQVVRLDPYTAADAISVQQAPSSWFPSSTHPGGFGWEAATGQLPATMCLARTEQGQILGWAGLEHGRGRLECRPEDAATSQLLADWLIEAAASRAVSLDCYDGRPLVQEVLQDREFAKDDHPVRVAGMVRPTSETTLPQPRRGYRIRPTKVDEPERVPVHRQAWNPGQMPYPSDILSRISPDAESRFDQQAYSVMRQLWLYDRELDLVIEAPDGSLAGCCTVWLDANSGWAEIEPLGIVPRHRGRGLAITLTHEASRLVTERGGHTVFINTAPLPHYPAPWQAYLRAGFTPLDRGISMSNAAR